MVLGMKLLIKYQAAADESGIWVTPVIIRVLNPKKGITLVINLLNQWYYVNST